MKSKQSKVFVSANSNRSETFEQQLQYDNPENNYEKLVSMPPDLPGKQFRNLIQSMSEHCSFEKSFIKKTSAIEIPSYVRSEIKRNEIYQDYQTIKKFTIFSKKRQHFETRKFASVSRASSTAGYHLSQEQKKGENSSRGGTKTSKKKIKSTKKSIIQNKPISMLQFVENKKNKMLMEDNILKTEENNVSNILSNSKKREKLFEEALLLERLYDIEIEKLKKVGVTQNGNQVPQKFRGIDPKHIRISSQIYDTEEQFLRKKYICKKRKLQYYNHAQKIEQSSLKNKKKQNLGVLETLMKYNEANDKKQSSTSFVKGSKITKQNSIYEQDLKIKRLFIKYSNTEAENPEQLYKYITQKQLFSFFADFDLTERVNNNKQLKKYIERKKQQTNKMVRSFVEIQKQVRMYLFDFLEIIYILASESSTQKSTCDIAPFLDTYIWSKNDKVIPQLWQKLKKIKRSAKMTKYLKTLKFEELLNRIFLKQLKKSSKNYSANPLLTFNDILQISWEMKLFPTTISKKELRFIYLYCKTNENGVSESDFFDLIIIISLKFSPEGNTQQKLKWIVNILQSKSFLETK